MGNMKATREAYGETLARLGSTNKNLIVMDADLSGSTKTSMFAEKFPDRFFNMGIAEQNMYAAAAGIALSGKTVCASTFAMFATGRAFEIIRNSIGYTEANVKICATHAGITVGEDGATHQTFEDIALMRTIPGMTVINPSDAVSASRLIEQAIGYEGPVYVRLGRAKVPIYYTDDAEINMGKANPIKDGSDVSIIATGILVLEAVSAAKELEEEGISVAVTDMHTIKPLDKEEVLRQARKTGRIVTAEEHSVIGGLGDAVAGLTSAECPVFIEKVGQNDIFGESGKPDELRAKYGMDKTAIKKAVLRILKK